jgi:hypothetical protein
MIQPLVMNTYCGEVLQSCCCIREDFLADRCLRVALLDVSHLLGGLCTFSTYFHYGANGEMRNMCRIIVGVDVGGKAILKWV